MRLISRGCIINLKCYTEPVVGLMKNVFNSVSTSYHWRNCWNKLSLNIARSHSNCLSLPTRPNHCFLVLLLDRHGQFFGMALIKPTYWLPQKNCETALLFLLVPKENEPVRPGQNKIEILETSDMMSFDNWSFKIL